MLLGDDMYSWILSCCRTGVTTQYSYLHIIDTISVTVMFIMFCNTVQGHPLYSARMTWGRHYYVASKRITSVKVSKLKY